MSAEGRYIPGLDGLRAMSIIFVIFGHAGVPKAPSSLGVTIFFFVSGFLITGLLLKEAASGDGKINIINFYVRRYLRLMPELALYVVIAALLSSLYFRPHRFLDVAGALFYFTNYIDIFSPSDPSTPFRLGHLWSLAVEEHFYLTWPILLAFCIGSARRVVGLALILIILPVAVRAIGLLNGLPVDYVRYASECRIDSIAYGCLLAALLHYAPNKMRSFMSFANGHIFAAIGIVLVICFNFGAIIGLRDNNHEILVYTGQGIGLFLLFLYLYASTGGRWAVKILEFGILRFVGKISYGFYLWHFFTIFAIANVIGYAKPGLMPAKTAFAVASLGTVIAVGLGWLSYRIALVPVNQVRRRFGAHIVR